MKGKRILVVDDEEDFVRTVHERLEFEGMVPCDAMSGEAALECIAREKPDLVVLDIMMPGIDGLKLFRHLREDPETSSIPVVFVSVRWDYFNDPQISTDGRVKVLRKPFELDVLVNTIRDALS
ncbi:MAG TPA: response regulator [bacterium]|nr:response regulator [bacterium]